jgi:hypothetical protein
MVVGAYVWRSHAGSEAAGCEISGGGRNSGSVMVAEWSTVPTSQFSVKIPVGCLTLKKVQKTYLAVVLY